MNASEINLLFLMVTRTHSYQLSVSVVHISLNLFPSKLHACKISNEIKTSPSRAVGPDLLEAELAKTEISGCALQK